MEPIRPIAPREPRLPEAPAVERIHREDRERRRGHDQPESRHGEREAEAEVERRPEAPGEGHIDVRV
jgi:hypothetical protein